MDSLFIIGQQVVCINSRWSDSHRFSRPVIEGKVYTITMIEQCTCGAIGISFSQRNPYGGGTCTKCGHVDIYPYWVYAQERFVPLDFSEYTEEVSRESLLEHLKVRN